MASPVKKADLSSSPVLDADAFWEMIEKLLLLSSSDEKARARHNLSLSALCKTQALPPLPRSRRQQRRFDNSERIVGPNSVRRIANIEPGKKYCETARDKGDVNENNENIADIINGVGNIKRQLDQISKPRPKSPDKTYWEEIKGNREIDNELKRYSRENVALKHTKSECSLKDLRVQLVRDANVPASEKLWRFAMQNKKKNDDDNAVRASPISRIRNNEAIYRGLRERLEEVEREAGEKEVTQQEVMDETESENKVAEVVRKKVAQNKITVEIQNHSRKTQLKGHVCPDKLQTTCSSFNLTPPILPFNFQNASPFERVKFKKPLASLAESYETVEMPCPLLKLEHFDQRKSLYDSVLKKRLRCGCKLESLNKEIVSKYKGRALLSGETTKRYIELKSEYLKLCRRESQLKHQIAMLHAEIFMMQNKGYHKKTASVKTITLDSKTPVQPKSEVCFKDCFPLPPADAPFFPPLKAPRPLIQPRLSFEQFAERFDPKNQRLCEIKDVKASLSELEKDDNISSTDLNKADVAVVNGKVRSLPELRRGLDPGDGKVGHASICSIYCLDMNVTPPQKHEPELLRATRLNQTRSLVKMSHRLPKLSSTSALRSIFKY